MLPASDVFSVPDTFDLLAGKHVQLAINLIAPEGVVAKSFGASMDADRSVFGLLLPIDPSIFGTHIVHLLWQGLHITQH